MEADRLDSDILVIGGGIAGLMAAIRARELGAEVLVIEKGNTTFSGAGRAGNDHFWAYIPEYHGPDMESFLKESMRTQLGYMLAGLRPSVVRTWLELSFDMVKLWDEWGIGMKHDGKYHFHLSEPMPIQQYDSRSNTIKKNAEALLEVIAHTIRQAPDQWLMFHPVWPEALEEMP